MMNVKYQISIRTSKAYSEGSTDSSLFIQLTGEDGSMTGEHELDNFWRNDFEQGSTDGFEFEDKNVGRIKIVKLRLDHDGNKDGWACDNVVVKHETFVDEFPLYDWIFDKMEVVRGEGKSFNSTELAAGEKDIYPMPAHTHTSILSHWRAPGKKYIGTLSGVFDITGICCRNLIMELPSN